MKLQELIRRLNPVGKQSFEKVTTEMDPLELKDCDTFSFAPNNVELRLLDGVDTGHSSKRFAEPTFDTERKIYNSPSEEIEDLVPVMYHSRQTGSLPTSNTFSYVFKKDIDKKRRCEDEAGNIKSSSDFGSDLDLNTIVIHNDTLDRHEMELLNINYSNSVTQNVNNKRRRLYLTLVILAVITLVVITLVVALILLRKTDSLETEDHTDSNSNHVEPDSISLSMTDQWVLSDIDEVNKPDENKTVLGITKLRWQYTTTDRSRQESDQHPKLTSQNQMSKITETLRKKVKSISPKLIRDSYKNAVKSVTNLRNTSQQSQDGVGPSELLIQQGLIMERAYRLIVKRSNITEDQAREGRILLNLTVPPDLCYDAHPPTKKCNVTEMYRTLDGNCNNFKRAFWGSVNQPYRRTLFADYEDGISTPRMYSVKSVLLPSPREISQKVHIDEYREDKEASVILPLWGHFIAHDIMYTATFPEIDSINSECCNNGQVTGTELKVEKYTGCLHIDISADDPFYSSHNIRCLLYQRAAPLGTCTFGPRQPFNKVTAFIDASHIYGVSETVTNTLRNNDSKHFGEMEMFDSLDGLLLLPIVNDTDDICNKRGEDYTVQNTQWPNRCFKAGDERVNYLSTITALHTIWVRRHNSIVETLSSMNPHWDNEKVFQETRRIVVAQIQHITYDEFLPEILSPELIKKSDLHLQSTGFYEGFDIDTDPNISNGFTTAFQFLQSMIQGLLKLMRPHGNDGNNEEYIQFHKLIMNPYLLWKEGALDDVLRGGSSQPAVKVDAFISGQLTHHHNQDPNSRYGSDLAALTIQKGRDEGLPPYLKWRQVCNLSEIHSFLDLKGLWDEGALNRVSDVYRSVRDVDLYTGMLSEKPMKGSRLGPTLSCIIVDQFVRLKKGDMFWYEGNIRMDHFTIDQLDSIRTTTLAKILCENSDNIRDLQPKVMLLPSDSNALLNCKSIPRVSLNPWREKNPNKEEKNLDDNLDTVSTSDQQKSKGLHDHDAHRSEESWGSLESEDSIEHYGHYHDFSKPHKDVGTIISFNKTKTGHSTDGQANYPEIFDFKK